MTWSAADYEALDAQIDAARFDEIVKDVVPSAPPFSPSRQRTPVAQRILTRAQLATLPEPSPLIDDTIDLGTVAILAGHFGTLKSFIALDWANSVATGHAWHCRGTESGRVLYVAGEGAYGLHKRVSAWELHHRIEVPSDSLNVLPTPINLLDTAAVNELCEVVHASRYRLVIVDTLAKATTGMDENSAMDMGRAVAALYSIQRATVSGTVIAVHHTGKDKSTIRGSSALEAGVDTVYITEGDAGLVKLSRTKRKDGPMEDVLNLRFEAVAGTNSGLVVSDSLMIATSGRAKALLSLFVSHFGELGASPSQLQAAAGWADATYFRALKDLVTSGQLVNTGTAARKFYVAGEAA